MNIPLLVADTIDVELYSSGSMLLGEDTRSVMVGPVPASLKVDTYSDIINPLYVSSFISFGRYLWGYLHATLGRSVMYLFNGDEAGLDKHTVYSYGGTSVNDTLSKIREHTKITAVFDYTNPTDGWQRLSAKNNDFNPK